MKTPVPAGITPYTNEFQRLMALVVFQPSILLPRSKRTFRPAAVMAEAKRKRDALASRQLSSPPLEDRSLPDLLPPKTTGGEIPPLAAPRNREA